MVLLSRKSWYSKAYFIIESWWAYGKNDGYSARQYEVGRVDSDICTFMRAFLVKLPIMLFAHAFMYVCLYAAFFYYPISHLGLTSYFTTILLLCGVAGICVGAYFGERKVTAFFKNDKPKKTTPTFLDIWFLWIISKHEKICVLMQFEDKEDEDV